MNSVQESYTKQSFSLDSFVKHAQAYLLGDRKDRPVCEAPSHLVVPAVPFKTVQFTFTDELLETIVELPHSYKKDFAAALTYGSIGASRGGKNGIVKLREEDARMQRRVQEYLRADPQELKKKYDLPLEEGFPPDQWLEGVKIVVHRKNGLRTIGIRNICNNHVLFFDRITYTP